jgi:putative transposase
VLREHGRGIAPNTYWTAKTRELSKRARRDEQLMVEIRRVFEENLSVYGADKIWAQLNDDGIRVARCTVERLMRQMGLVGNRRGRTWTVTTVGDERLQRPADLVDRDFTAPVPNRLWVADLTYVKAHSGWVYVAFVIDVFSRMVVGWQASKSLLIHRRGVLARPRRRRVRHHDLHRLVQPPAPARHHHRRPRLHHTRRPRDAARTYSPYQPVR